MLCIGENIHVFLFIDDLISFEEYVVEFGILIGLGGQRIYLEFDVTFFVGECNDFALGLLLEF